MANAKSIRFFPEQELTWDSQGRIIHHDSKPALVVQRKGEWLLGGLASDFLYLGEVPNMPGHSAVVTIGYSSTLILHTENIKELKEGET